MADGGRVVPLVGIMARSDGDGPGHGPGRGGKGQRAGNLDFCLRRHDGGGGTDVRRHRHGAGGGRVQPHGVGRRAAFGQGEGGAVENQPGPGGHGHDEDPAVVAGNGEVQGSGIAERDGHRRGRGGAEHVAGALAHPDDGGALASCVRRHDGGGDCPVHRDGQRGRLRKAHAGQAVPLPHEINAQLERFTAIA